MAVLDPNTIIFIEKQAVPLVLIMILTFYAVRFRDKLMLGIVSLGIVSASLRIGGAPELNFGLVSVIFLNTLLVFYYLLTGMEAKHKVKVAQAKLDALSVAIEEHNEEKA